MGIFRDFKGRMFLGTKKRVKGNIFHSFYFLIPIVVGSSKGGHVGRSATTDRNLALDAFFERDERLGADYTRNALDLVV